MKFVEKKKKKKKKNGKSDLNQGLFETLKNKDFEYAKKIHSNQLYFKNLQNSTKPILGQKSDIIETKFV